MSLQRRTCAVRAFGLATRIAAVIMDLPSRLMPPPFRLLQIGSAYWQSRALHVAAELDIATVLGGKSRTVEDLARDVDAQPDALNRLMQFLTAMGVFKEVAPGLYRNNKLSDALRTDRTGNVRALVLMHNSPEMTRPWCEQLETGIRTGKVPFELAHGQDFYDYMDGNPQFDTLFAEAMNCVEALSGDSFATDFDWSRFRRVVDVGGSNGTKAAAILKRHPNLRAVVVDRPPVIHNARAYWAQRGQDARMQFAEGDVFSTVPTADDGDVYLLSAVLHGFDDHACARALATVAKAAGGVAPIVVLEFVVPERKADVTAASFDMQMLVATRGRERTRTAWRRVFAEAGVALTETVSLTSFGKMMVLRAQ